MTHQIFYKFHKFCDKLLFLLQAKNLTQKSAFIEKKYNYLNICAILTKKDTDIVNSAKASVKIADYL